jgi:ribosomal protein L37AE/L43A
MRVTRKDELRFDLPNDRRWLARLRELVNEPERCVCPLCGRYYERHRCAWYGIKGCARCTSKVASVAPAPSYHSDKRYGHVLRWRSDYDRLGPDGLPVETEDPFRYEEENDV